MAKVKTVKEFFKGKSDKYLKDLYISCYDAVMNLECFSCRDVKLLDMAEVELERRGYEISSTSQPKIIKVKK